MPIDWNTFIGQYPCYEVDSDFRTFNDVAGCVALIPKQIDTPALKDIRQFLEDYNRKPKYHGSSFEHNEDHITLKELLTGKTRSWGNSDTKDMLVSIKNRIKYGLLDSSVNLLQSCNQNIKWKKIPLTEHSYREEWDDTINGPGKTLCSVDKEMMMTARDLSDAIGKEEWNYPAMIYSLKGHIQQNWIKENAWDFTADEIKSLDLDKELGLKDDK